MSPPPSSPPATPQSPDKQNKFHPLRSQQLARSHDNQFAVGFYIVFFSERQRTGLPGKDGLMINGVTL